MFSMTLGKRSQSWAKVSDSDVVNLLAREHNLSTKVEPTTEKHAQIEQNQESDVEVITQPDGLVETGRGEGAAVGAERWALYTPPVWPISGSSSSWRVVTSHSRMVLSRLAEARVLPSGLNATLYTPPVWPMSGSPNGWRVVTSHIRIVASLLAEAECDRRG